MDVVSLAANLYRRGIPVVKIPSTLLGVVDAGLGAKTAVNFYGRKNLIGTFDPPTAIIVDTFLLSTTSNRSLRDGIAEMMKIAIARDEFLWSLLEQNTKYILDSKCQDTKAEKTIIRAIDTMVSAIWTDLWEVELNRPTDFGHSISKAIEEDLLPRPTHGEAVIYDMAIFLATATQMNMFPLVELERVIKVMISAGLKPDHQSINTKTLKRGILDTRIHRDGRSECPLPNQIGSIVFCPIELRDILAGQKLLRALLNTEA